MHDQWPSAIDLVSGEAMNEDDDPLPGGALCALIVIGCIVGVGLVSLLAWWVAT
jgi:hypothetical protein